MYKFCVFGGTTEGRKLTELLSTLPCETTVCVATDYGQTLLPESEHLTVSAKKLPVDEIVAMLSRERFDLVIDATHPYAASITRSIARACEQTGTAHWRLLRGASAVSGDAVFVESTQDAVRFLQQTDGNILLTTGSKARALSAADRLFRARLGACSADRLVAGGVHAGRTPLLACFRDAGAVFRGYERRHAPQHPGTLARHEGRRRARRL